MHGYSFSAAGRGLIFLAVACAPAWADAVLKPEAIARYDAYIRDTEARIESEIHADPFLWSARPASRAERVRAGEVVIEPGNGNGLDDIGDALIHDWIGAVFIPGVRLDQAIAFLQDYSIHKNYYRPEVIDSRLLGRQGDEFHLYYRITKKKIVTVVVNANITATYTRLGPTRALSMGRSTRIAEVKDAGQATEHEAPVGHDHGFLWRLNTYWRMEEKDGGVYLECRSVTLSRSVPAGLGWLIFPIIRTFPRESLTHLLKESRNAILAHSR